VPLLAKVLADLLNVLVWRRFKGRFQWKWKYVQNIFGARRGVAWRGGVGWAVTAATSLGSVPGKTDGEAGRALGAIHRGRVPHSMDQDLRGFGPETRPRENPFIFKQTQTLLDR